MGANCSDTITDVFWMLRNDRLSTIRAGLLAPLVLLLLAACQVREDVDDSQRKIPNAVVPAQSIEIATPASDAKPSAIEPTAPAIAPRSQSAPPSEQQLITKSAPSKQGIKSEPTDTPLVEQPAPTPKATPRTNVGPELVAAKPPLPPARLKVTDRDPIHDRTSPAHGILQRPSRALKGFPLDRRGRVDWVQALAQGHIKPRADVHGKGRMKLLDGDILMTNTRSMPHVLFPHRAHTEWLACSNCHPRPFRKVIGANANNMDEIFKGRSCGLCHDKVAFSTFVCERCHSVPHDGSPAKWW